MLNDDAAFGFSGLLCFGIAEDYIRVGELLLGGIINEPVHRLFFAGGVGVRILCFAVLWQV